MFDASEGTPETKMGLFLPEPLPDFSELCVSQKIKGLI